MPSVPTGKGFYERQPAAYPNGDSIAYAQSIGCSFIMLHMSFVSAAKVSRAQAAGLRIWFWSGPLSWEPLNWQATYTRQMELTSRYRAQGAQGFIPDIEDDRRRLWAVAPASERTALLTALRIASTTQPSIGFTSYPQFHLWEEIAEAAPAIWGSPQLYGLRHPGQAPYVDRLRVLGARWAAAFGGGYAPSIASWDRPFYDQAEYLADFVQEEGVIFWHGMPVPRPATRRVLAAYTLVGQPPASAAVLAASDTRMGTQLSRIQNTVEAAGPGYANRLRQAYNQIADSITVSEVTGTGAAAIASASGRDRIAAMARVARMQDTSRVSLYAAAQDTTAAVTTAMARSSARTQQTADSGMRLPVIINARGFDFTTGQWVNRDSVNQMSASELEAYVDARDDNPSPAGTE